MSQPLHIKATEPFRWEGVPVHEYKADGGTHFKDITRQLLFDGASTLGAELRYFEMEAGGHSTLERHEHVHSVLILRGKGEVLVGNRIHDLGTHDLVYVPPLTWHQFRATKGEPLGFLCLVKSERDKPQRPDAEALARLRTVPEIAAFLRV